MSLLQQVQQRAVVARADSAQIEDDAIVVDARDDGRVERAQVLFDLIRAEAIARELDEARRDLGTGRATTAYRGHAVDDTRLPPGSVERAREGVGAGADLVARETQHPLHWNAFPPPA